MNRTPAEFLADLHAKAQAQRFAAEPFSWCWVCGADADEPCMLGDAGDFCPRIKVAALPVGETADSDWGSLLEEPIREMLTEQEQ